jgi:hypothetical protein
MPLHYQNPIVLDPTIPFAQAKSLDVILLPDDCGKADIFIDDCMVIIPDIKTNRERAVQALLLAIHSLCCPLDPAEPIFREDCLSLGKLAEEGRLSECFNIIGWNLNTRNLKIALPPKKFNRWNKELREIIFQKKGSLAKLESTIGRLNHAAAACPIMRYFLSRIRLVLLNWDVSQKTQKVERYLSTQVLEDFKLWRDSFLPSLLNGMSTKLDNLSEAILSLLV